MIRNNFVTTEFHKIIKECRKELKLSQKEISKNLGIKKSAYSAIENNNRPIPKYVYDELDKHYNFEQFELHESLLEQSLDLMGSLNTYELLCLVWKLQNICKG